MKFQIHALLIAGCSALALHSPDAKAWDLELDFGTHKVSPTDWNAFSAMNASATAWDATPSKPELSSFTEMTGRAYTEFESWGKWGAFFTLTFPKTLSTSGKATGSVNQTKTTSIGGFRLGPDARFYPMGQDGSIQWFVGGRIGLGIFSGTQTYENGSASSVSYRAWSAEFAISTGAEIPVGPLSIVAEVGYSRLNSSYFASTGTTGSGYSDFSSGTRIQSSQGAGYDDLKLRASGVFAVVGLQMTFGENRIESKKPKVDQPALDDYEGSATPAKETEEAKPRDVAPEKTPEATPTAKVPVTPPAENPAPAPATFPAEESVGVPTPKIRPTSAPSSTPESIAIPERKRETWEIDTVPMGSDADKLYSPLNPVFDPLKPAIPSNEKSPTPAQPDSVPLAP